MKTLQIKGMHCASCVSLIKMELDETGFSPLLLELKPTGNNEGILELKETTTDNQLQEIRDLINAMENYSVM